jgi:carboxypeptidase C (cathepsin A)
MRRRSGSSLVHSPRVPARLAPSAGVILLALLVWAAPGIQAQSPGYDSPDGADAGVPVWADSTVVSEHTVTIGGQTIPYRAEVGTQPVWDEHGEVIASVFYVAYTRTDVQDRSRRPLMFSFNGGPGSASVWMHIGYTGPRFLNIDDEGFPVQPYGVSENPHSVLDVTDIVFVDPVNVGFSRIVGDQDRNRFFGVNQDIEYLARWIDNWVGRHQRWESPKYLIGESYGTTRVAGLAARLQNAHWMYLNGVILVSPTGLGISRAGPISDALKLPYQAATAWYHGQLASDLQNQDLYDFLPDVEEFTVEEYIPALVRGGFLDDARRTEVARTVARYSGLSEDVVRNNNLAVPTQRYWKELLRDEGRTVGRLDSRYRGVDRDRGGERYDFDPALTSWNHSFAPAINHYLRGELGWVTDLQYWVFGPVQPWDRSGDSTGEDLRQAMAQNPFLHVLTQAGYYDGATDYFSAKYTMWNMDPSGELRDRLHFRGYRSGHMMYLRQEDLASSNQDIREFIEASVPEPGAPARW